MREKPLITITLNEKKQSIPAGLSIGKLRDRIMPMADVLVVNGFPSGPGNSLKDGDRVVFISRGGVPKADELEALMVARHTPGVHERMKAAMVGVAGLGGLGSAVTIALARMGIGTLILADYDVVEPSNLNRQHYALRHIGMAKTDAMAQILADLNPYIRVITHNVILERGNIPNLFKETEIIVECFDRAEAKAMILNTVSEFLPETFIIGASGLAGYGDSNSIRTMKLGDKIFMVGDLVKAAEPGRGLMAPRVGIAAHHQANLVVALLMDPTNLEL
ncbi:MAG: sulfur carrier protein ThiS adenylyltransferase ThiF [Pseudomonadota bacterium]